MTLNATNEFQRIEGPLRWQAHAVISPNGQPIAVLELPDCNYVMDRDSALKLGLSIVAVTMRLYPTAHELCDGIRQALDVVDPPAAPATAPAEWLSRRDHAAAARPKQPPNNAAKNQRTNFSVGSASRPVGRRTS